MTKYTYPHSLPIIEPTVDKIAAGGTTNLAGNINALSAATNQAMQMLELTPGPVGPANKLTVGTVTTVADTLPAEASVTGAAPNQVLNLKLPRGLPNPDVAPTDIFIGALIGTEGTETAGALTAAIDAKAVGRGELQVSVLDHGAVGDGAVDDTTAALSAAEEAIRTGAQLLFPAGHSYKLTDTVDLSAATRRLTVSLPAGAVVIRHGDGPAFKATGALGATTYALTADIKAQRNEAVLSAESISDISVGESVLLVSSDVIPNSVDKIGYLRKISLKVNSTTLRLDAGLPRVMTVGSGGRLLKARMHPGVELTGSGQVRHIDSSNLTTLVDLTLVENPVVKWELGPSGSSGVTFSHCNGGVFDGYVHDLVDDEAGGHFGYGVDCRGASRNMKIRGRGDRCRHAFTTNAGPNIPGSAFHGEPENVVVTMATSDCTNKAIDTHRAGWGIHIIANNQGGNGAVQVRSDNAIVEGTSSDSRETIFSNTSAVSVATIFRGIKVQGAAGTAGTGFYVGGPAIIDGYTGNDCRVVGLVLAANGVLARGIDINGTGAGSAVIFQGSKNFVADIRASNVGTALVETTGATGNGWGREEYSNVGQLRAVQAYPHEQGFRTRAPEAAATLGTVFRRIPVIDSSGAVYGYIPMYGNIT